MAVKQFTLRVDADVYDQIEARAKVMGRSINKEIETLLAYAIQHQVDADEATFQKMRDYLAGKDHGVSKTAAQLGLVP